MSLVEHELVCPMCGAPVDLKGGVYECTNVDGTATYESLAELGRSGRTRDRQHDVGGFPTKPRAFR